MSRSGRPAPDLTWMQNRVKRDSATMSGINRAGKRVPCTQNDPFSPPPPGEPEPELAQHQPMEAAPRKTHLALYSPGIVGLGHLRRNLLIAQVLAESELKPVILMVTEAREASAFVNCMPPGMDCLTLPGLSKGVDGVCRPRYLDLPLNEVLALRSRTIKAALKKFDPDIFIVDNLPRG